MACVGWIVSSAVEGRVSEVVDEEDEDEDEDEKEQELSYQIK